MTLLKCPHCGNIYEEKEFKVVREENESIQKGNISNETKTTYYFEYENEQEYRRLERNLKKYNMMAYKKLYFDFYQQLRSGNFLGDKVSNSANMEKYELCLPTDSMFSKVHGKMKLIYSIDRNRNVIVLNSLEPKDVFSNGHAEELAAYKGVIISKSNAEKDMFKINLLNMLDRK